MRDVEMLMAEAAELKTDEAWRVWLDGLEIEDISFLLWYLEHHMPPVTRYGVEVSGIAPKLRCGVSKHLTAFHEWVKDHFTPAAELGLELYNERSNRED
jgi:hypothetical protein